MHPATRVAPLGPAARHVEGGGGQERGDRAARREEQPQPVVARRVGHPHEQVDARGAGHEAHFGVHHQRYPLRASRPAAGVQARGDGEHAAHQEMPDAGGIDPAPDAHLGERRLALAHGIEVVGVAAVADVLEAGEAVVGPITEANGERSVLACGDADRIARDLPGLVLQVGMAARRRQPEAPPAEGRHSGGYELDGTRGDVGEEPDAVRPLVGDEACRLPIHRVALGGEPDLEPGMDAHLVADAQLDPAARNRREAHDVGPRMR